MCEASKVNYAVSVFKEVLTEYVYFHDIESSESKKLRDAIHVMEDFCVMLEKTNGGDQLKLRNAPTKLFKIANELEDETAQLFVEHRITSDEGHELHDIAWRIREMQVRIEKDEEQEGGCLNRNEV